ncbi:MAG: hypothetical protein AWU54_1217 [Candidatus Frackibacter sp. T328-2]|nr:MAG: hypothetical protein AWU54_1217 [Candidatus Frackibacter sp. T328-2]
MIDLNTIVVGGILMDDKEFDKAKMKDEFKEEHQR